MFNLARSTSLVGSMLLPPQRLLLYSLTLANWTTAANHGATSALLVVSPHLAEYVTRQRIINIGMLPQNLPGARQPREYTPGHLRRRRRTISLETLLL
ncbi:hypothetical protein DFH09DRAFT_463709 [Mycena vulgaris]|nr:hypothetical protein DFH09DRAFT_463709 [Mycena vulgaris]